ncbi:MAG: DNA internalization-related competence protein ComEC/Rec2 [Gammaproteobacteria bacterium]|nr:DNA internalization-related competence protein ComEC/Rec2 [Gammaproteobacteria bacterium]MBU1415534.1 DNA internalization-related competence protein ComEC/Rec2 [Gammaproteobacteria bacterium]
MRVAILSFAAGIAWLQFQPELPESATLAVLVAVAAGLLAVSRRMAVAAPVAVAVAVFLIGVGWAGYRAQYRLADALPEANEGRDVEVVGVVAGLPQAFDGGLRFDFDVEQASASVPSRVSVAWYGGSKAEDDENSDAAPAVVAGERWRLLVRLKRPHGNVNPHGFDYEAWLFERGIRATGYVRKAERNARLDELVAAPGYLVERLRQRIRDRFQRVLADAPRAGILVALAIGDQRAIAPADWRMFARTGVTHLLSVSGLHVTMVAGLAAGLLGWAWRRVPRLALRLPTQKAMAAAGFLAALAYALIAGFGVPAQRTLYMLTVVALALWSGRNFASSRVLALALLLVLILDPWAVLAAGFWLSFGAVALLFYIGSGRLERSHWLATWGRAQWAITLGLIPALLALFQQFSLVSPLANAIAIPLVSLVVTPLALIGALPLTDPLLWLAHGLTDGLMRFLEWLAASDWAVWQQQAPPGWAVLLGALGVGWLLLPGGFPARWLGAVAMLPLLLLPGPRPVVGEAMIRVLDVGQGLAVHVQTAGHDLLYDAGPAYSADADAGDRLVVPYLRAVGVRRLDALVISHQDRDHEGGAGAVLAALPTALLTSSLPETHSLHGLPVAQRRCVDGQNWTWDGVRFEMLHPTEADYGQAKKSNALSCVLKVSSAFGAVLLTGDIEARTEGELLVRHQGDVAADVLLPPHHGSRSSSSAAFIGGVSPRLTFVSAGYRNRFGHPAQEVVDRYAVAGIEMRRTDRDGALTLRLGPEGIAVESERARRRRYWHAG